MGLRRGSDLRADVYGAMRLIGGQRKHCSGPQALRNTAIPPCGTTSGAMLERRGAETGAAVCRGGVETAPTLRVHYPLLKPRIAAKKRLLIVKI
jgi:hypothetical protein